MPVDPLQFPSDDFTTGKERGGGAPYTGPVGGGTGGGGGLASIFGGAGSGAGWAPFYSGQGSGYPPKRRWQFLPGQQGGAGTFSGTPATLKPGGGPGQMFAGQNSNPLYSILDPGPRIPGYGGGGGAPHPSAPRPPQAPGTPGSGYVTGNGTFDMGAFLRELGGGHYFDSQNDVLSQLLDQRGAANERNAVLAANSEFANDPSLQGYARLQARIGSGRDRTAGLLSAKRSQQDFINELYKTLGLSEYGHKINMDAFNRMKPKEPSDFERFMASIGPVVPF